MAWEFMKKLSNSPWAPVIRLIEDPETLGIQPALNLKEDLDDCAVVVEETESPVQKKTSSDEDSSEEDSDSVPRYCPSVSDSDDAVVICEEIKPSESSTHTSSHNERLPTQSCGSSSANDSVQRTTHNKPGPKSKVPFLPSSGSISKSKSKRSKSKPGSFSKSKRSKSKPASTSKSKRSKSKQPQPSSGIGQVSGENDSGDKAVVLRGEGGRPTESINYSGQTLELKPLKVVLIDLARVHEQYAHPLRSSDSSGDERDEQTDKCENPTNDAKSVEISSDEDTEIDVVGIDPDTNGSTSTNLKNSGSSNVDNRKRPCDLSWGLDSIHELEKRRKLDKTVRNKSDDKDQEEVELVTPCSSDAPGAQPANSGITSRSSPKPTSSEPLPNNTFGLNAWRLALVVQELLRLQELAEKLQKDHLKPDLQKSVAYKFKYGLSEVARLVTKKSLNSIVAEQAKLELEQISEKECRALKEKYLATKAVPESRLSSTETSLSCTSKEVGNLDDRGSNSMVGSFGSKSAGSLDQPVVDVYVPTLVQGVAAGFLSVFDRLERLESKFDRIESTASKSNGTPKSIGFGNVD